MAPSPKKLGQFWIRHPSLWLWCHMRSNELRNLSSNLRWRFLELVDGKPRKASTDWSIWRRGNRIVAPHALTPHGGMIDVPPYTKLDATDPGLPDRLREVFTRDNLTIVRRMPAEYDHLENSKAFFKAIGVRSWKALYAEARHWSVHRASTGYSILCWKRAPDGRGGVPDNEATDALPKNLPLDELIELMTRELTS